MTLWDVCVVIGFKVCIFYALILNCLDLFISSASSTQGLDLNTSEAVCCAAGSAEYSWTGVLVLEGLRGREFPRSFKSRFSRNKGEEEIVTVPEKDRIFFKSSVVRHRLQFARKKKSFCTIIFFQVSFFLFLFL